jgi:hypothetical protein
VPALESSLLPVVIGIAGLNILPLYDGLDPNPLPVRDSSGLRSPRM